MEWYSRGVSIALVPLTQKSKTFLRPKVLTWLPSAVNCPSGSKFTEVFDVHLDERYREGLIPPGALRCKEQGQRVF